MHHGRSLDRLVHLILLPIDAASLGRMEGQVLDMMSGRLDLNTLEVFLLCLRLLLTDIINGGVAALWLGDKQSVVVRRL